MIYLFLTYASSGATLVNQCLGLSEKIVILSELNPLGGGTGKEKENSLKTVQLQLEHWYDITVADEDFASGLLSAESLVEESGHKLIVRDWSYINFTKHPTNHDNPPNRFLAFEALESQTELKVMALIRNPIDVWISRNFPPIDQFVEDFQNFSTELKKLNCQVFYYEDFVNNPTEELQKMLEYFDVTDETEENLAYMADHYYLNEKVNGSTTHGSRGAAQRQIAPLPRKVIFIGSVLDLMKSQGLKKLCKDWGYSPHYFQSFSQLVGYIKKKAKSSKKIFRKWVSKIR